MKDNVFEQLSELNLIDANGLRNFVIREKYRKLRSQEFKSKEALDIIHLEYKNLAYNTIRKIIFRKVLKREGNIVIQLHKLGLFYLPIKGTF